MVSGLWYVGIGLTEFCGDVELCGTGRMLLIEVELQCLK